MTTAQLWTILGPMVGLFGLTIVLVVHLDTKIDSARDEMHGLAERLGNEMHGLAERQAQDTHALAERLGNEIHALADRQAKDTERLSNEMHALAERQAEMHGEMSMILKLVPHAPVGT